MSASSFSWETDVRGVGFFEPSLDVGLGLAAANEEVEEFAEESRR